MKLTQADYDLLERCYITPEYADAAGLWRADSLEGRERIGRNGGGDFAGIVFPYFDVVARAVVGERLRLDHPPVDSRGKPEHKYLQPPGQRNRFYAPLADPAWFEDQEMPVLIVEGEKAYLAAHRAAIEAAKNGKPLYCAIALGGAFNWKGVIGKKIDSKGHRVDEKGPVPDWNRFAWKPERKAVIAFDSNAETNDLVRQGRIQLSRELVSRGAAPFHLVLPQRVGETDVNGPDDFLAAAGREEFLALFRAALRWDWYSELAKSKTTHKVSPGVDNALIALRLCPELTGLLAFNEFAERAEMRKETPWKSPAGPWTDRDDTGLRAFLERKGVPQSRQNIRDAVDLIAHEASFHPVREYLGGLVWDGVARLNGWLTTYAGAPATDLTRAVAAKWMISAVARVYEPGCKADHMLILEGPQGAGKSQLLETLGGDFFIDDVPELTNKDAQLALAGAWIVEFPEMDTIGRAEASRIKSFLSRSSDHYRAPYGHRTEDHPRQCVFAGTVNRSDYGNDETGLRRYWPITCGVIDRAGAARDRDQLWGEALERYRAGEPWWFDDERLIAAAVEEQAARQRDDPWDPIVHAWLFSRPGRVTTSEVLADAIKKPQEQWSHLDKSRAGAILTRMGRICKQRRAQGEVVRFYYEPEDLEREEKEKEKGKEKS